MPTPPALEARGITKQFPGVLANDHVSLSVKPGEIHVLLGENGAGKTTLMNILYGLQSPDSGEIYVRGKPVRFKSPNDAIRQGIGMVHQHFMLVPVFTVTENIILGVEQTYRGSQWLGGVGWLDRVSPETRIRQLSERFGLAVDPSALVGDLPVGGQQRVEIIKALYRGAQILILDEPTAVLTPQEVAELFQVIRSLIAQGLAVIFITHKLREVLALSHRISVLRQGRMVGTVKPSETDEARLAEMMVGRQVILQVEPPPARPGEPILQISHLRVLDDRGHAAVNDVSLSLCAGEILGLAGVQGNGQTELVEAITGLRSAAQGSIRILDWETTAASPRQIIETGVAHIPEDREKHGLVKTYSLVENLVLCTYYRPPFAQGGVLQDAAMQENARRLVQEFDLRPANPHHLAGALSGGNKQKVIIARELSRGAKLLIASQPTRGVDVGSIEFIHQRLVAAREQGLGVFLVSAELDEILALSDRVAVIYQGQIIDILPVAAASRERIGLLMAGVRAEVGGCS